MDIKEYISSGILELYVYGALSEVESREVSAKLKQHPEVRQEVEEIEAALLKLAAATAPYNPEALLASIKQKLMNKDSSNVVTMDTGKSTPWVSYIGWAASLLLLVGLFFLFNDNHDLREQLNAEKANRARMEQQLVDLRDEAQNSDQVLAILRSKNISRIQLQGQDVAPNAYAAVYWNKSQNKTYIDGKELPQPPRGKVYQVWSLKMDPLTPTSIGLLDTYAVNENKIFELENSNESEAFGITLEPEGGSKSPTMEQLYVLGTVSTP